jgi:transcriptional regulator with XRE-family HTH domain
MVSDRQVKRPWRLAQKLTVEAAAAKSGMDSKTARKYLRDRRLPSEMPQKHTWRTRPDPFADTWEEIRQLLTAEPELQPKTLFKHLQRTYPGRFEDGQVRTLRRGLSTGGQRKDRRARCSSHKNTGLVSCVNQTSHIAESWASLSMGKHFHI